MYSQVQGEFEHFFMASYWGSMKAVKAFAWQDTDF
jgi:hypothetical protein